MTGYSLLIQVSELARLAESIPIGDLDNGVLLKLTVLVRVAALDLEPGEIQHTTAIDVFRRTGPCQFDAIRCLCHT